jgi:RNA polymerase sigma factor (sigma-70 family)
MGDNSATQHGHVSDADSLPCSMPQAEAQHAALIGAAAEGSVAAFEMLYRVYRPRLSRFLEQLTHRPALAEEVLNDTMFTVWRKAGTYNGRSKVSTWIFAIGYRKALKARKHLDDPVEEDPRVESNSPLPDNELLTLQLNACLSTAMRALSPAQRTVIELTYFHGYDYPEIAAIVRCPLGTVKTRMFHARRKLERLLAASPGKPWV